MQIAAGCSCCLLLESDMSHNKHACATSQATDFFCVITTLVLTHKAVTEHDNQAGVQRAANKPPLAM